MSVIGFSFTKFECERKAVPKGGIEVKHNINISDVSKTSLTVTGAKTDVLKIEFNFDVLYEKIGAIKLVGEVVYSDTKEIVNETEKAWKADKKLNATVNEQVFKFVYNKAIMKALALSDDMNLPSPIPMPKLNFQPAKK